MKVLWKILGNVWYQVSTDSESSSPISAVIIWHVLKFHNELRQVVCALHFTFTVILTFLISIFSFMVEQGWGWKPIKSWKTSEAEVQRIYSPYARWRIYSSLFQVSWSKWKVVKQCTCVNKAVFWQWIVYFHCPSNRQSEVFCFSSKFSPLTQSSRSYLVYLQYIWVETYKAVKFS